MNSIAIIFIINILSGCTAKSEESVQVTKDWLEANLYRVDSYKENEDGTYSAILISLTDSTDITFEELQDAFNNTTFTIVNGESLADGVNCQGMTTFVADWCIKHQIPYTVYYTSKHTYIIVHYSDGKDYEFNFSPYSTVVVLDN